MKFTGKKTFKKWKTLSLHIYKSHENERDYEGNKMEITGDNAVHKDEDEDDKAGLKPNNESMKEANKDISSTWNGGRSEYDQHDPNLINDENNIWKGRRRKLSQTSLTLIPVPVDNQDKRKKRLMSIEYRYQGYQCSCNDKVWRCSFQ